MRATAGWIAYVASIAACLAIARRRWNGAEVLPAISPLAIPVIPAAIDSASAWLEDADDVLLAADPFRVARVPATIAYNPATDGGGVASAASVASTMAAPPHLRPNLTLKAIVGGPPWQAIIDGIPGQASGTVVRAGATFDRLAVRAVTRDSVIVQGPDTAWILAFRRQP